MESHISIDDDSIFSSWCVNSEPNCEYQGFMEPGCSIQTSERLNELVDYYIWHVPGQLCRPYFAIHLLSLKES